MRSPWAPNALAHSWPFLYGTKTNVAPWPIHSINLSMYALQTTPKVCLKFSKRPLRWLLFTVIAVAVLFSGFGYLLTGKVATTLTRVYSKTHQTIQRILGQTINTPRNRMAAKHRILDNKTLSIVSFIDVEKYNLRGIYRLGLYCPLLCVWGIVTMPVVLSKCFSFPMCYNPANTKQWKKGSLALAQRLWRWPNKKPTLLQCLVFAGTRTPAAVAQASLKGICFLSDSFIRKSGSFLLANKRRLPSWRSDCYVVYMGGGG